MIEVGRNVNMVHMRLSKHPILLIRGLRICAVLRLSIAIAGRYLAREPRKPPSRAACRAPVTYHFRVSMRNVVALTRPALASATCPEDSRKVRRSLVSCAVNP